MSRAVSSTVVVLCLLACWSVPALAIVDEDHWECETITWTGPPNNTHYESTTCSRIINGFWCYAWVAFADGELANSDYGCFEMSNALPMPPVDQITPYVRLTNYTIAGTLVLTRPDSAAVLVGPGADAVLALPNPLANQILRIAYPSSTNPSPNDSVAIEFVNAALAPTVVFHRKTIQLGNGTCGAPCERAYVITDQGRWVLQDQWAASVGATRLLDESPANHDTFIRFTSSLPPQITVGVPAAANPAALSVRVFPSPSRRWIGIQWTTQRRDRLEFALRDIAGRTLRSWQREVGLGQGAERIDLRGTSEIPPGVYFLSVRNTGGSRSLKTILLIP